MGERAYGMTRYAVLVGHGVALAGLGIWGVTEVGSAGTLTIAFWLAWIFYAALVMWMRRGGVIGAWLVLVPPLLWAVSSGADIVPQLLSRSFGGRIHGSVLIDLVLVTLPCVMAVVLHLLYAAHTGYATGGVATCEIASSCTVGDRSKGHVRA